MSILFVHRVPQEDRHRHCRKSVYSVDLPGLDQFRVFCRSSRLHLSVYSVDHPCCIPLSSSFFFCFCISFFSFSWYKKTTGNFFLPKCTEETILFQCLLRPISSVQGRTWISSFHSVHQEGSESAKISRTIYHVVLVHNEIFYTEGFSTEVSWSAGEWRWRQIGHFSERG